MKYLGVAGVLLGLSLLGVPALADEAKQPVPRVGQVVIESMGPASGTIPKGKLATIVNYIHADKHTWYKNGSRHTAKYPFRGCPACFLILKGVVISSHETNRFS